jgi:hypothetical protein
MRYVILLVCALAFGCSSETEEKDESVLYDAAREPLDKAESVEETLLEAAEERDEAIEESGD